MLPDKSNGTIVLSPEVQSSLVASMRLLDGSSIRFVLPERDPHTLHRTINMLRRPLFQGSGSQKKMGRPVTTHYEEEPHPECPTILGE